jgi:hypothetical protein
MVKATVPVLALLAMGAVSLAQASILTFDTPTSALNAGYGNNISSTTGPSGSSYGVGPEGFTPNVTVSFLPQNTQTPFSVWGSGYASLTNALGHSSFNIPGILVFTPEPTYAVTLYSFDIATWVSGSYSTDIWIWDNAGSFAAPNLFSQTQTLSPSTVYSPLNAPVTAAGPLNLYVSNIGSTGLDNVRFGQAVVPLPAALWLFGPALALLGAVGLRTRRR